MSISTRVGLFFFAVSVPVFAIAGCSSDDDKGGNSGGSSTSTTSSSSSFCCGLNSSYYDCPTSDALTQCAKGDTSACTSRSSACPK